MISFIKLLSEKPRFGSGPSVERCLALLEVLSVDPTKIKSVGITGSNGKGSTANILSAILRGHGIRTGLFTSPHFLNPNERFRINGEAISESTLEQLAERVLIEAQKIEDDFSQVFSRFELLSIMAFLYFKNEAVDIAILEAGIGGRLDPTRLAQPKISCIASLDLEHTEILGDTLDKIFKEKLLLLERGGLCYASIQEDRDLRDRCRKLAEQEGITLRIIEEEYKNFNCHQDKECTVLNFENESFKIPLLGNWQGRNFILALVLAKEILSKERFSIGTTKNSLKNLSIPGRFEKINSSPEIYIDSAHTPEALREVVSYIKTRENTGYQKFVIVLGISKNKPVQKMLEIISDLDAPFFVSCSAHGGAEPEVLAEILINHGKTILGADKDLEKVLNQAKNYAKESGGAVFVLGGLFFASDVSRLVSGVSLDSAIYL